MLSLYEGASDLLQKQFLLLKIITRKQQCDQVFKKYGWND